MERPAELNPFILEGPVSLEASPDIRSQVKKKVSTKRFGLLALVVVLVITPVLVYAGFDDPTISSSPSKLNEHTKDYMSDQYISHNESIAEKLVGRRIEVNWKDNSTYKVTSYDEFKSSLQHCPPNGNLTLIIAPASPSDWPDITEPLCGHQIQDIVVNGQVKCEHLHSILFSYIYTKNIIFAESMSVIDWSEPSCDLQHRLNQFVLGSLESIQIHCRTCETLYTILAKNYKFPNLSELVLSNQVLTEHTGPAFQKFVGGLSSIQGLKINLSVSSKASFLPIRTVPSLKRLEINVTPAEEKDYKEISEMHLNVCFSFPSIRILLSDKWIFPTDALSKCTNLEFLDISIYNPEIVKLYSILTFVQMFPHLKHLKLFVNYKSTQNCDKQGLRDWDELECKTTIEYLSASSSNCPIKRFPRPTFHVSENLITRDCSR